MVDFGTNDESLEINISFNLRQKINSLNKIPEGIELLSSLYKFFDIRPLRCFFIKHEITTTQPVHVTEKIKYLLTCSLLTCSLEYVSCII